MEENNLFYTSERQAWRAWLAARQLPITFAAETVCDVCRDEWLFEVELDAVRDM